MAGMTFPGMTPLIYAPAPDFNAQLAALGKTLQGAKPGIAKIGSALSPPAPPTMPPGSPGAPMNIAPGANQPSLMDALKGMSPQQILAALQGTSQPPAPPAAGLPGSAALDSAGMLSGGVGSPMAAARGRLASGLADQGAETAGLGIQDQDRINATRDAYRRGDYSNGSYDPFAPVRGLY